MTPEIERVIDAARILARAVLATPAEGVGRYERENIAKKASAVADAMMSVGEFPGIWPDPPVRRNAAQGRQE
jgi:hypothetical protein